MNTILNEAEDNIFFPANWSIPEIETWMTERGHPLDWVKRIWGRNGRYTLHRQGNQHYAWRQIDL